MYPAYTFPFALSALLAIDGVERCALQGRCKWHTLQMSSCRWPDVADGTRCAWYTLQMARRKTASLLIRFLSVWRQWLPYKWINNPKAKVNSLRTILKRSFSLAFMRANCYFYFPNANSQFSCICIWRQVRREHDHVDCFPVSFLGSNVPLAVLKHPCKLQYFPITGNIFSSQKLKHFLAKIGKNWPKLA